MHTNRLIDSSSPYLLQHAHNPVDWFPWGEEALQKAQAEDKPIIVSIGYSACHWCHVMERESFENEQIAVIMNQYFVCIKVDREERPDVDAIYMDAVQTMGLQGGWPLNAFLTPTAKPFYAGTYFPPQNWANLLGRIGQIFKENRQELEDSAEQFRTTLNKSELQKYGLHQIDTEFRVEELDLMFDKIALDFDTQLGGMQKAPKFPMPCLWTWLLQYAQITPDENRKNQALQQVFLTLKEIHKGGIYDQIGGGWARYSVDAQWFAPHFEKMLYDNGQLISLYSKALSPSPTLPEREGVFIAPPSGVGGLINQTIDFLERELMSEEGGFYSALDADSEGVEGKFYVWTYQELVEIFTSLALPEREGENTLPSGAGGLEFPLFCQYYNVKEEGNWEHDFNILHRKESDEDFAKRNDLNISDLQNLVKNWQKKLLKERAKKIRPGLDDKILTAWNGLILNGLTDAYRAFGEEKFLELALENAYFIKNKIWNGEKLFRTYKKGIASLDAYLEDYAAVIEAFTNLYQATFDQQWLDLAQKMTEYTLQNFYDPEEEMFFFTDQNAEKLIARKKEIFDNVIPASNSMMAKNLHFLGLILDNTDYQSISRKMLGKVKKILLQNVEYLANWGQLYCLLCQPTAEIVIVGEDAQFLRQELDKTYFPNKIVVGSFQSNQKLALLANRGKEDETLIYVCYNQACQLPVRSVEEAWKQIKNL